MSIQLFAFDTPNGRKISVALEEMGLEYSAHIVDITKDEQFKPEFLAISPNNKIPAIIDSEGPEGNPASVFESGAILIYLAEKTGKFLPTKSNERIAVFEWLMFQMGGFGPAPGQVHHFLGLENKEDQRYGLNRFMTETKRLYKVMDQRLESHEYFAGGLSIADFAILGWVWRHPRHQIDLGDYPNVKRWYDQLMARPAVERGFAVKLR
jgi:GST-like protein